MMTHDMSWQQSYEIGIAEVDNQHKNFLMLINKIHAYAEGKYKVLELKRLVEELILYAQYHFYSEENHMMEIGYPHFQEHAKLHEELLSSFSEMVFNLNCITTNVFELHKFLLDWFKTHTIMEDKKISEYSKYKVCAK